MKIRKLRNLGSLKYTKKNEYKGFILLKLRLLIKFSILDKRNLLPTGMIRSLPTE